MSDYDQVSLNVIERWSCVNYHTHAQSVAALQEVISEAIEAEVGKVKPKEGHRKLEQFKDY